MAPKLLKHPSPKPETNKLVPPPFHSQLLQKKDFLVFGKPRSQGILSWKWKKLTLLIFHTSLFSNLLHASVLCVERCVTTQRTAMCQYPKGPNGLNEFPEMPQVSQAHVTKVDASELILRYNTGIPNSLSELLLKINTS